MMFEEYDEWIRAISEMTHRHKPDDDLQECLDRKVRLEDGYALKHLMPDPDYRPIANLLRSDKPMPSGIRDRFAELLDPSEGNPLGVRLVIKQTETLKQSRFLTKAVSKTTIMYQEEIAKGKSAQDAAVKVADTLSSCDRTVFNHLRRWRNLLDWLKPSR